MTKSNKPVNFLKRHQRSMRILLVAGAVSLTGASYLLHQLGPSVEAVFDEDTTARIKVEAARGSVANELHQYEQTRSHGTAPRTLLYFASLANGIVSNDKLTAAEQVSELLILAVEMQKHANEVYAHTEQTNPHLKQAAHYLTERLAPSANEYKGYVEALLRSQERKEAVKSASMIGALVLGTLLAMLQAFIGIPNFLRRLWKK